MSAPLTKQRLGSTHCPECERPLMGGQDVIEVEGDEFYTRKGSVHMGEVRRTVRRWHRACLADCQARIERSRAESAAQRERDMRAMCEEAGVDYDEIMAKIERERAEEEATHG